MHIGLDIESQYQVLKAQRSRNTEWVIHSGNTGQKRRLKLPSPIVIKHAAAAPPATAVASAASAAAAVAAAAGVSQVSSLFAAA
jgi:hypothetical protein